MKNILLLGYALNVKIAISGRKINFEIKKVHFLKKFYNSLREKFSERKTYSLAQRADALKTFGSSVPSRRCLFKGALTWPPRRPIHHTHFLARWEGANWQRISVSARDFKGNLYLEHLRRAVEHPV